MTNIHVHFVNLFYCILNTQKNLFNVILIELHYWKEEMKRCCNMRDDCHTNVAWMLQLLGIYIFGMLIKLYTCYTVSGIHVLDIDFYSLECRGLK